MSSEEKSMFLVQSKVKSYIKEIGESHNVKMVSGDALDGLNEKVCSLIEDAIKRTTSNKRATLRKSDF